MWLNNKSSVGKWKLSWTHKTLRCTSISDGRWDRVNHLDRTDSGLQKKRKTEELEMRIQLQSLLLLCQKHLMSHFLSCISIFSATSSHQVNAGSLLIWLNRAEEKLLFQTYFVFVAKCARKCQHCEGVTISQKDQYNTVCKTCSSDILRRRTASNIFKTAYLSSSRRENLGL